MECSIRFVVIIVEWKVEDSTSMVDLPLFFCLMFMGRKVLLKEAVGLRRAFKCMNAVLLQKQVQYNTQINTHPQNLR